MNAIMPRATIEDIVRYRDQAMVLYEVAHTKIVEASDAIKAAHEMARNCHPGTNSYNHAEGREIEAYMRSVFRSGRNTYALRAVVPTLIHGAGLSSAPICSVSWRLFSMVLLKSSIRDQLFFAEKAISVQLCRCHV